MLNRSTRLTMSTSVLKALRGKLDVKRREPAILYIRDTCYVNTATHKLRNKKRRFDYYKKCSQGWTPPYSNKTNWIHTSGLTLPLAIVAISY